MFICEGGGGGCMVGTSCPEKYLAYMYNFICGESVYGYGNRSTGKWVK